MYFHIVQKLMVVYVSFSTSCIFPPREKNLTFSEFTVSYFKQNKSTVKYIKLLLHIKFY